MKEEEQDKDRKKANTNILFRLTAEKLLLRNTKQENLEALTRKKVVLGSGMN